jgi:hypothetical protein
VSKSVPIRKETICQPNKTLQGRNALPSRIFYLRQPSNSLTWRMGTEVEEEAAMATPPCKVEARWEPESVTSAARRDIFSRISLRRRSKHAEVV